MVVITLLNTQDAMPTIGLGYLASYYMKYGKNNKKVKFKIIECARSYDCRLVEPIPSILSRVKGTDILAMATITQDFTTLLEIADKVKKKFGIPIIMGGHHISALPQSLPSTADIGVIGEGEQTFAELIDIFVKQKKFTPDVLKKVLSICYHDPKTRSIHINPRRPVIEDLDIIPVPARHLFNEDYWKPKKGNYEMEGKIFGDINTSRGCPYDCVFCSSAKHWGNRIRFFSAERVVAEIKELHETYGCDLIGINDDLATVNMARLEKIADLMEKTGSIDKIQIYSVQARADVFNQRLCNVLKRLKVKKIAIGVESGSDKTLRYIKGGNINAEKNREVIKLALKNGFEVWPQLIVGAPGETKEDVLKTLEFTKIPGIVNYQICLLTPLPGTRLWEYAKSKGLVSDSMDWSRLSLEVNEKNISKKVYLCEKISRRELWHLIKEPLERVRNHQLRNVKINIKYSWKEYLHKTIKQPQKYIPLIKDIIFAKIMGKIITTVNLLILVKVI